MYQLVKMFIDWWNRPRPDLWVVDWIGSGDLQIWYSHPPKKGEQEKWTLDSTHWMPGDIRKRVAEMREMWPDPGKVRIQVRSRNDGGCQEW